MTSYSILKKGTNFDNDFAEKRLIKGERVILTRVFKIVDFCNA